MSALTIDGAVSLIAATAARIADAASDLSRLDAVAGDGDHGLNVSNAFAAASRAVAAERPTTVGAVFAAVGRSFREQASGSAGALFGTFFAAVADELGHRSEASPIAFFAALRAGERRLQAIGRAQPGDKTMLDALDPAIDAGSAAADRGASIDAAFEVAATAAEGGAAATTDMRAAAGRARYVPDGGVGQRDPGAQTIAIMFAAWASSLRGGEAVTAPAVSRLDRLATSGGQFAILALDHVRSFAVTMRPDDPDSLSHDETLAVKERLIAGLAEGASAILVDPRLAETGIARRTAELGIGLIVGIEDGDYEDVSTAPRLLPGWTVDRAAGLGADAVKISVFFDPQGRSTEAERFVRDVARDATSAGLPLFCEPLAIVEDGADRRSAVLEGVRRFGGLGVDVLKVQFPGDGRPSDGRDSWADACGVVDALSPVPWALLSEGRAFTEFRDLLDVACTSGASGFLAGRAIWGGAAGGDDEIKAAATRLGELRSIATASGRSWHEHGAVRDGTVT